MSASRSIADAHRQRGGEPADAARAAAERLREQAWALSEKRLRSSASRSASLLSRARRTERNGRSRKAGSDQR